MLNRLRETLRRWRSRGGFHASTDSIAADDQKLVLSFNQSRIPSGRQWRTLPTLFSKSDRLWIRFSGAIAVIGAIVFFVTLSSSHVSRVAKQGGTITIGFVGTPQFINPVLAQPNTLDADLTKLLFRGVAQIDRAFQPVPDLAESITASDDRKTYTVKLKPDLKWSDGEPLTADDVRFTIETIKDPNFASPYRSLFQTATVETPDERTAVITLEKALTAFPYYFEIGLLPFHAWSDATPQTIALAELNVKPITDGPYKFLSVTKDRNGGIKSIAFTRNKFYHAAAPYAQKVVAKFYPDRESAIEALKTEAIDVFGNATVSESAAVAKKDVRTATPISQITAVFFNQKTNVAIKALEVRQALAMVIDRPKLIEAALPNHAIPLASPILPKYPGYDATRTIPTSDMAAAVTLLEQKGWKKNDQGFRQKGSAVLAFSLTIPDEPTYISMATTLTNAWKELGANVEVKTIDTSRIQRDVVKPRTYDALLFGQIYDADGDLFPFWHSSQQRDPGYNLALFYDKTVDAKLGDARSTTSFDTRSEDYRQFAASITDQVPAIFLVQQLSVAVHRSAVRGLPTDPTVSASSLYTSLPLWYVKTTLTWR